MGGRKEKGKKATSSDGSFDMTQRKLFGLELLIGWIVGNYCALLQNMNFFLLFSGAVPKMTTRSPCCACR